MAWTARQKNEAIRARLETDRASFIPAWRDCQDFVAPRKARFTITDVNKGDWRNQKIIDTSPSLALRDFQAGMHGGITPPSRPWFKLTTPDPDMAEFGSIKEWLFIVNKRMEYIFQKSNFYNVQPMVYKDLGLFGNGVKSIEEDFLSTMRCYHFPVGSYMLAKDHRGKVSTFVRDFQMTVEQIVNKFGKKDDQTGKPDWSNISIQVKDLYERGQYHEYIDICHIVRPNDIWDPSKGASKFKRFSSVYYERGNRLGHKSNYLVKADEEKMLSEKGFDFFPLVCDRWEVTGEDVYATDWPCATAIGDIKQLMHGEKKAAKAIDKMVDPAMIGHSSLRNKRVSILPGDITYTDDVEQFRAAHDVNFRVDHLELKQQQVRQRIDQAFYRDLFLMFANDERNERATAREIDARDAEKLLMLGPVYQQLNDDDLNPTIDLTFELMMRQDMVPPPPEELAGQPLRIEYVSTMANAQKMIGISSIERFTSYVLGIFESTQDPRYIMKANFDELIEDFGDRVGVDPKGVRTKDEVEGMVAQQQQQEQMIQGAELMKQSASAAKDLSQAKVDDESALTEMMNQVEGA